MKKKACLILCLLSVIILFAEENNAIDINGLKMYSIQAIEKGEELCYERISTDHGFQLELVAKNVNGKTRVLGKFLYFSGWVASCSNNILYFSISNAKSDVIPGVYKYSGNNGKIERIIDAFLFNASEDGRYICYAEPWQVEIANNHPITYWYIYDTVKTKEIVIITEKFPNNHEVNGVPKFDKITNSFLLDVGYDDVVVNTLQFNPYDMKF